MEESQNNNTSVSSAETFEQKIIRNVQAGGFAVYKTPEVVGGKTLLANIEWEDPEQVDKFFAFAKSMGAKVIYVAESEDEEDEVTGQTKMVIVQVGFLHSGVMHHINLEEDEDEEEDEYDEDDEGEEYEDDEGEEYEEDSADEDDEEVHEETSQPIPPQSAHSQPTYQAPVQPVQQQVPPSQPQQQSGASPQVQWPRPQ